MNCKSQKDGKEMLGILTESLVKIPIEKNICAPTTNAQRGAMIKGKEERRDGSSGIQHVFR
jgi:hypothetical protein